NVIAERTGIVVVADFRRADLAAGGQGAPLLPALHAGVLADTATSRAILNLGGIANVTLLVPGQPVLGFDTGPANCLLDAWSLRHRGNPRDDRYFALPPPKSTGREYFHLDWLDARVSGNVEPADVQATLLQLSARSIADALRAHAPAAHEVYACGGGVHNAALMDTLRDELSGARLDTTATLGL